MTTKLDASAAARNRPAISKTPPPPYWAAIITLVRTPDDPEEYAATATEMWQLVREQRGYLAMDSVYGPDRKGIIVAYFANEVAIREWKANAKHRAAQKKGREKWYETYRIRIAKVERDNGFP
jgi:heme-degrading monooxygenase HmoA